MKIIAIVQARMGSSRFPNKVMQLINGLPLIGLLLHRLSKVKKIDQIVLATSTVPTNATLISYVETLGYLTYSGSEMDVLDRYYQIAKQEKADVIVRITGDCPLLDPELIEAIIDNFLESGKDYISNSITPTFPDGLCVEVFSSHALNVCHQSATSPYDREHVTPYIRESSEFSIENYSNSEDYSLERWTVDEPADLIVVQNICDYFHPRIDFSWREILALNAEQPALFAANRHLTRNEGATIGMGPKLWKRAKRVIPGGNMLLSKRAEMFLPDFWPSYFSKSKGCKVWDLDGNEYIDMSIMGIGTNILGYGHPEVDEAVRATVDAGNMSTFNCPEEVYLAERLVELHPWADMVRFARTGGEANALAIRIARAASGKEKVAFCGYHGWHDWYLAANLGNEQTLAGHLLPGLEPNGVPSSLRDTIFPFNYNRLDELKSLIATHDIGVIKMEVSRNFGPEPGFLEGVRELATRHGIVLIFDECTSGFRETFGGIHKLFGVEPDMAMFGKALGNGYAITATIGRRAIMEAAQTSFISSTFWTERIGPTAGLKTLEVMEKLNSWEIITDIGHNIKAGWKKLGQKHGLELSLWGLPALSGFTIESAQSLAYKTLITQEMLSKGYLASNCLYACIEHTPSIIEGYFDALDPIFGLISECEAGRSVKDLLKGPICHAGFKRLN